MKKLMKRLNFAIVGLMASVAPALAAPKGMNVAICKLAEEFGSVFGVLRTLAFVGAGFVIAGWAWSWISEGKGVDIADVKKKGIGLLVGFIVLFAIGSLLTAFMSMAGEGGSLGCDFEKIFN